MENGITVVQQPGAARSLCSVEAADAYLSHHPYPRFVEHLRQEWLDRERYPIRRPPTKIAVNRYIKHMRAALAAGGVSEKSPLWRAADSHGTSMKNQYRDESGDFWRRMVDEPKQYRLALALANAEFNYRFKVAGMSDRHLYSLTGGVAAVLAVALGVDRPPRHGEDPAKARLRAWEKRIGSAKKYLARLRAEEVA